MMAYFRGEIRRSDLPGILRIIARGRMLSGVEIKACLMAADEIDALAPPHRPDPLGEASITRLDQLIDRAIGSRSGRLRSILADALSISGPAWHRFRSECTFGGSEFGPDDRALVSAFGRKVHAHREGYIPSWVSRKSPWDEASSVVLPPTIVNRLVRTLDSLAAPRVRYSPTGSRPPWR